MRGKAEHRISFRSDPFIKIPLSRIISPKLYWVMSGDDFSLDINNPDEPKILCVGSNPDRQNIYSAALAIQFKNSTIDQ
jgi:hypothetical protein